MRRRTFFSVAGLAAATAAGFRYWPDNGLTNPCVDEPVPADLLNHDLVQAAWDGIDATTVWDMHAHLIGVGDNDSGIYLHPNMRDPMHPAFYLRYKVYMNAVCAAGANNIDASVMQRFIRLSHDFPPGARFLLLAFDYRYDEQGRRDQQGSSVYVPNSYAAKLARTYPDRLGWIASIHPYRGDAAEAVDRAVADGALAVKWLPAVMGIDPSSPLCDRFYSALLKHRLPLLTHAGHEYAVAGENQQDLGNPLLLRRPLEQGVQVIVAHCASAGSNVDIDRSANGPRLANFDLFARLMDEPDYIDNLYGDIAAITQINRVNNGLETLLLRDDWHDRLMNGSDYPLPGVMPLFSPRQWLRHDYINESEARVLSELRRFNPLLFDFVAKRSLRHQGKGFSTQVFQTRRVLDRHTVS